MEKEDLISEIIDFCFIYGILDETVKLNEIKGRINNALNECEFIENFYNMILLETKNHKKMDIKKIRELLLALERLRLELEFKDE